MILVDFKQILQKARRIVNNNAGVAIITAVMALAFMTYLATEVTYDATVEYIVNSQELKRLKAYYAARSGVELSLLRIKAYQQVVQKLGKNASNFPMVNMIWNYPLQIPLPIAENAGMMTKDEFKEANAKSFFDANIDMQISEEGSKIDLTDLNSPSKVLRDSTRKLLMNVFTQQLETDKRFDEKYRSFRFDELINQIADFMSDKRASLNGGDKTAIYTGEYEGYPPNRAFRTVSEMRIIPMMDETLFNLLQPRVTIFGLKGINPNVASKEVLMSLDPEIKAEIADKIIARREDQNQGGPFKSADEFWSAVNQFGARVSDETKQIPIVLDSLISFRIKSTGVYSNVRTQIEVVVSDIDKEASRVADYVKKENPNQNQGNQQTNTGLPNQPPNTPTPNTNPATTPTPIPQGPPRILFWSEY
jgi:general secretion pathway protein K